MRFSQRLSSHLTPEWRKHYVQYESLKRRIYEMVGERPPANEAEEEKMESWADRPVVVDADLEEAFFEEVERERVDIDLFFRSRVTHLEHLMGGLKEKVDVLSFLLHNRRTRNLRSTRRNRTHLRTALSEFYYNLILLQNFQQLNHTGFRKVLKKYDKLARRDRGGRYFKEEVCKATFWTSKAVVGLIDQTEELMIEKVELGDRSKAMNTLRVPPLESRGQASHWNTLWAGWLMGVIFVLLVVFVVAAALRPSDSWGGYTPSFRGLRAAMLLTLWFYAFAINTYGWRRGGVNNVLIFEFDPRNYLNFVEIFEVASLLGVFFMIGLSLFVFSHWLGIPIWVGPLVSFVLILLAFVLPLPILHYRSRIWLFKELARISLAPFFDVTFPDFWIADQLNSLAVILLDVEFFLCYLFYGLHFPDLPIRCGSVTYGLRSLIAALPAWWRFAQCLRRYYDTRKTLHLVNAGKYSTSFFVIFFSSLAAGLKLREAEMQGGDYYTAFFFWILSAIVSSCYTFTWDIKMDWGLFEGKYKLRSELIYSSKVYYMLAVLEDLIFRSLWTLNISVGEAGASILEGNILGTILAVMEVFRRFIWNFFRLENEHLNNCGEFRVVRDISLRPLDLSSQPLEDAPPSTQRRLSNQLSEISLVRNRRTGQVASQHNYTVILEDVKEEEMEQEVQQGEESQGVEAESASSDSKEQSLSGVE